jgi:hypothetical protein
MSTFWYNNELRSHEIDSSNILKIFIFRIGNKKLTNQSDKFVFSDW